MHAGSTCMPHMDSGASFISDLDPYSECEPMAYDAEASCAICGNRQFRRSEIAECSYAPPISVCITGWIL